MPLLPTKKLLQKVIQASSQPVHVTPYFYLITEIISNLQSLSVVMMPLYFFCQSHIENSLNTFANLAYYIHLTRILGKLGSGSGITICTTLIGFYLASLLLSVLSAAFLQRRILSKMLALGLILHSKVLFYCIHYFLIQSLKIRTDSSEIVEIIILIILACVNFALALFKDLFLFQPLRTKSISSPNTSLYPLITLLQKTLIICLLYFLNNPKISVITLNIILTALSLYLALGTFPFYNLTILRTNIVFTTLSFSFSVLIIPEVNGTLDYSFFIILAVSSLFVKISLSRLDYTLQKVIQMKTKDCKAAIMLPSLFKEWIKKLNVLATQQEFTKETLLISGFVPDALQDFAEEHAGKALENLQLKCYKIILGYFQKLREKNPNNELLLLNFAHLYVKKFKDIPKAMETLNYLKSISPSLTIESVIIQLSETIRRQRNSSEHYESYFERKNRILFIKTEIQKEISEHINLWKLLAEKDINTRRVSTKALEISRISQHVQRYWQVYFQDNEGTDFEFVVNYGYYLDIVQGLGHQGLKLIKSAYKSLENKAHAKVADDSLYSKTGAILVVSIEQERQGKILNTCHSANSLFEVKKGGGLVGMDINSIIPKAFCAQHSERISHLYASSKLNVSSHPASYVRTLDEHYFKAELNVHLNSSMDQGLSFVVHVKRISENESLMMVDHNNRVTDFSKDIGQVLNLKVKEHHLNLQTLCPDLIKSKGNPKSFLTDFPKLKEKNESVRNSANNG